MKIQRLRDEVQKGLESDTIAGEEYQQRFIKKRAVALKTRGMIVEHQLDIRIKASQDQAALNDVVGL